ISFSLPFKKIQTPQIPHFQADKLPSFPPFFKEHKKEIATLSLLTLFIISTLSVGLILNTKGSESTLAQTLHKGPAVLAEASKKITGSLIFNIPTTFNREVLVKGDLQVEDTSL